jgi:hypothetical protein
LNRKADETAVSNEPKMEVPVDAGGAFARRAKSALEAWHAPGPLILDDRARRLRRTMPSLIDSGGHRRLVDPKGYDGTGEARHQDCGSCYGDQVN